MTMPRMPTLQTTSARPSKIRYWVVVFAIALSIITYIDRVCISLAAPAITKDLKLTDTEMGWALSLFAIAYAAFEIPGGWLGDKLGARSVLMRIVIWWSFFTAATAFAWNAVSLWVIRFLFGMGEAGCFPNITKAYTTWLPAEERVRAQGITWMSARWGGAFTPPLLGVIMGALDWRMAFIIFGALGVVWAVFFYGWFRDNPKDNPKVNAGELKLLEEASQNAGGHGHVPWGKLLTSTTVWLLWLQYFCVSYGWYFYITWLPTYLQRERGMDFKKSAILSGMPLFLGGIGCLVAGFFLIPRLTRILGSENRARRYVSAFGCALAGCLLILSTKLQDPLIALITISFASFANDLQMPASWGTCMSLGGKYAGTLSGSMNMMGNLGGALAPIAIPLILKWCTDQGLGAMKWDMTFYVSAAMYAVAMVAWLVIDTSRPIDQS